MQSMFFQCLFLSSIVTVTLLCQHEMAESMLKGKSVSCPNAVPRYNAASIWEMWFFQNFPVVITHQIHLNSYFLFFFFFKLRFFSRTLHCNYSLPSLHFSQPLPPFLLSPRPSPPSPISLQGTVGFQEAYTKHVRTRYNKIRQKPKYCWQSRQP